MDITRTLKNPPVMVFVIFTAFFISFSIVSSMFFPSTISFYSTILRQLSIIAGLFFVASLFLTSRKNNEGSGRNLLEIGIINKFARWRCYKLSLQIPTLAVFIAVTYFGFFGPLNSSLNVSTVLTWTIWWAAIIFTFVLMGRLWCTACPFAFLGDISQKIFSLGKKIPRRENGLKIQMPLFLILTLLFVFFGVLSNPLLTAIFIVTLTLAAVSFALIFEKRAFCRYICPIGAVTGLYSMVSPLELRSKDCETCRKHIQKKCFEACPMAEYIGTMDSNFNCTFCMDCVKACPKDNIVLRFRGFGRDLWSKNLGMAGAFAALLIFGVSIIQTVAMMEPWPYFQNVIASLFGVFNPGIVYLISFALIVVVIPLAGYSFFVILSNRISRTGETFAITFSLYGLMFMPLGIAVHLAHNVSHLLVEGAQVIPATAFSLGLTSQKLLAVSPFQSEVVFWLQALVLFIGYFLALFIGNKISLARYGEGKVMKPFAPMIIFAMLLMIVGLYIFALPMNLLHVH